MFFQKELCLYCHMPFEEQTGWAGLLFLTEPDLLCEGCRSGLAPIHGNRCDRCSRPMHEQGRCQDCIRWEETPSIGGALDKNISLYTYNSFMKEYIARFKYRGDYELARLFGEEIRKAAPKADMILPVPLSEERMRERGFNQARALGEMAGLKMQEGLVRMHSEKQAKMTRRERIERRQVFEIHPDAPVFRGKTILLIDDIYTTGTTLRQAGILLKEAGARRVLSVTIAR
ncbi:amidophosphoribosyltransferase [Pradoshia eiseniae]|uniref:Amidophosphoribosyltransferase n=1 Tax=Pradoshia eiseniae TaxID=2064768 RepID=A0A2S7N2K5_9BACI|nr:ComF family protein [Pradoshia eiseniae]PQD96228.1 amidophosphoribosyltransferase [Pradoshia eiseniae]